MILEKDKDGWWTYENQTGELAKLGSSIKARSELSDLDAVVNAHCCGLAVELERIPEPLADEIYAAMAKSRNCNNCATACPDAGTNADWPGHDLARGCADWKRRNS